MDAGCNCGAPVVPKSQRIADAIEANLGNRAVAKMVGVNESTVRYVRKKEGAGHPAPENGIILYGKPYPAELKPRDDEPPTTDNPP